MVAKAKTLRWKKFGDCVEQLLDGLRYIFVDHPMTQEGKVTPYPDFRPPQELQQNAKFLLLFIYYKAKMYKVT